MSVVAGSTFGILLLVWYLPVQKFYGKAMDFVSVDFLHVYFSFLIFLFFLFLFFFALFNLILYHRENNFNFTFCCKI